MPYKDKEKSREYHRKYRRLWIEKNRRKSNLYQRKYYWLNREKIRNRKNAQIRKSEQEYQIRARKYHRKKIEVLKRYGGDNPKCSYCSESRYECLQIDHINDDGNRERLNVPSGENFYYWVIRQPFQPNRYQVLCANCNHIKRTRGIISYQKGLKTIQEWEEWSKLKTIPTPKELKELWIKKSLMVKKRSES